MTRKSTDGDKPLEIKLNLGLGGILGSLGDLVQKLAELEETTQGISRTGEIRGRGETVRGVYGFNVKVGLGGEGVQVEPFGNIRKDQTTGQPMVAEVREPMVDLFEEKDHVLIVAEMPGVGAEDIHLDIQDDILTLSAERGDKKYHKEILLPESFPREKMTFSCNNGVVEIKCLK